MPPFFGDFTGLGKSQGIFAHDCFARVSSDFVLILNYLLLFVACDAANQ